MWPLFGEKDFQQLAVIRRMVADLGIGVEIVSVPTVRETDGLALSSRNAYLSVEERQQAVALPDALDTARDAITGGEYISAALEDARNCSGTAVLAHRLFVWSTLCRWSHSTAWEAKCA